MISPSASRLARAARLHRERGLRLGAGILEEAEPEEINESSDPSDEHNHNARSQKGAEQAVTRYLLSRPQCHDPASVLSPLRTDGKACYPRTLPACTTARGARYPRALTNRCPGHGLAPAGVSSAGSEPTILGPP